MGLEMVADDHYVRSGGIGCVHCFGRADAAANNECDRGVRADGSDDLGRDGCLCTGSGFEIDGFFAHQFGCDTGANDCIYVGRRERFGVRYAHSGSLYSTVNQNISGRDHFDGRVMDCLRRLNMLTYKVFGVISGQQREV